MDAQSAEATKGQTAVVTGASSGIGMEMARLLAAEGYSLVLVARREAALEALASELRDSHGSSVMVLTSDLSRPEAPGEIFEKLRAGSKSVDILVNSAGFGTYDPFVETPLSESVDMLELNIVSLTKLTRLAVGEMLEQGRGRILNVASTAAFQPGPLMAVYYATKAYVLSFSEALSHELRGSGITVTALCPGPTESGFQDRADMQNSGLLRFGLMDAASVARAGYRGMQSGRVVVIPGAQNWLLAQSVRVTPRFMVRHLVNWIQKPVAPK